VGSGVEDGLRASEGVPRLDGDVAELFAVRGGGAGKDGRLVGVEAEHEGTAVGADFRRDGAGGAAGARGRDGDDLDGVSLAGREGGGLGKACEERKPVGELHLGLEFESSRRGWVRIFFFAVSGTR